MWKKVHNNQNIPTVLELSNFTIFDQKYKFKKNFGRGNISKGPAGFVMTYRFVANTPTHCATLVGNNLEGTNY